MIVVEMVVVIVVVMVVVIVVVMGIHAVVMFDLGMRDCRSVGAVEQVEVMRRGSGHASEHWGAPRRRRRRRTRPKRQR